VSGHVDINIDNNYNGMTSVANDNNNDYYDSNFDGSSNNDNTKYCHDDANIKI
jgi:hypothetical protein